MKVALIGGVTSTEITFKKLISNELKPAKVYGYEPEDSSLVSAYVNLREHCLNEKVAYEGFKMVNSLESEIINEKYDLVFVVGLSQLVSRKILEAPRLGCVGFHPTKLPRGRGRAPVAWLVLEEQEGAASFFVMGEGADDGPLLIQEPFEVNSLDTATSIEKKSINAISVALDKWLPELKNGHWNPVPQDEALATYFGKRTSSDGIIDWNESAFIIDRLIRSATRPHPGAYTYFKNEKMIVWSSEIEQQLKIKGVPGRVLVKKGNELLVQCAQGCVWLKNIESKNLKKIKVGMKLGIEVQDRIQELIEKIEQMESRL
jgi:methionyl-tRNA formyltransferase